MSSNILTISLETSIGNGEDSYLTHEDESGSVTIGVFDGLGGRSAGFDGQKGGRIASTFAAQIAESLLKDWKGNLTSANAIQLYNSIKTALKAEADAKMPVSRLKGTLAGKRLCTTVSLANVSKCEQGKLRVNTAWMGDSRIYFLGENQGLQQLTLDDLEVKKDAFDMIREDPPMSKFISADSNPDWQINYSEIVIDEQRGCFLACTDGCFQYLSTPWDFERLLLETLSISDSLQHWKSLLTEKYQQIKQDDVSLLIYPIGFSDSNDIQEVKESYKSRYQTLNSTYSSSTGDFDDLVKLWNSYRNDYEAILSDLIVQHIQSPSELNQNTGASQSTDKLVHFINESEQTSDEKQSLEDEESIKVRENVVTKELQSPNFPSDKDIANKNVDDSTSNDAKKIAELYSEGLRYQMTGSLQEAIHIYSQILYSQPHHIDTNFQLGMIHSRLKDFDAAIRYLEIVRHLQIKHDFHSSKLSQALVNLAFAHYQKEDYEKACTAFGQSIQMPNKMLDLDIKNMQFYAFSLCKIGRDDDAIKVCGQIRDRDNINPYAFYIHGIILYKRNILPYAEEYLRCALKQFKAEFQEDPSSVSQEFLKTVENDHKIILNALKKLNT
jgi:serine/threonine protein phosphatase PrpC